MRDDYFPGIPDKPRDQSTQEWLEDHRRHLNEREKIRRSYRYHFEKAIADKPEHMEQAVIKTLNWIVSFGGIPFQIVYKSDTEAVVFYTT